ncbi:hypothetical protein P9166_08400 [Lactococcus lactis]|nr:hypothetical protein P9166_08400 [Lactococcus lactis]
MAKNIFFIDTCILLDILKVPTKYDEKNSLICTKLLAERAKDGNSLIIMPISVIIETGNHINHIKNASQRSECYKKYLDILNCIQSETLPWQLFGYDYKNQDLDRIISLSTELSNSQVGIGDIFILDSFNQYLKDIPKGRNYNVEIWTKDKHLKAYSVFDY